MFPIKKQKLWSGKDISINRLDLFKIMHNIVSIQYFG